MKNKKCKHVNLKIWRTLNLDHFTEVSVSSNEDEYHEAVVTYYDSNEWDMRNFNKISVSCSLCEKEWKGKKIEDFPNWIQQVLEQEERHFEDL